MCLQNICCRIDEGNYTVCVLHMSYSDDVKDIPFLALCTLCEHFLLYRISVVINYFLF